MEGLMSVGSPLAGMTADQAIANDAKSYTEGGRKFVLAQIEESQMALFHRRAPELSAALHRAVSAGGLDFMALMVTDPVRGNSELMFAGDEAVRRALPYRKGKDGVLLMPGVLSRKKQLLPEIIAALT
jgi:manganese-dependent inorganic pyrophosphatase